MLELLKVRIPAKSCLVIDKPSLEHSEETMKKTWFELREALANNTFTYIETEAALNVTFLKQFDNWLHGVGKEEMTVLLSEVFQKNVVGRGSKLGIKEHIEKDSYNRFIPISEHIKDDNRFSPSGVEWLYLAIGDSEELIKECAEKECRANSGQRFGFCKFDINDKHENLKLIDLTIADKMSYDEINNNLREIEEREFKKSLKYTKEHGLYAYKSNYNDDSAKKEITKWLLFTYAKMLSKNIFVPLSTEDKKLEYAPFQTLAMYFIKEDFDGIIYSSTVCPNTKNIVLFNKQYAIPYGDIQDYIVK